MRRFAVAGLLALLLLPALAGFAVAEDDPVEPEPKASTTLTLEELGQLMSENPLAFWLGLLSKYGSLAIGIVLLARYWLFWDKVRGGQVPAPPMVPAPPALMPALGAILIAVGVMVVLPGIVLALAAPFVAAEHRTYLTLAIMALVMIPTALWIYRRQRIAAGAPPAIVAALEAFEDQAAVPVAPWRAPIAVVGGGLWAYFVASVLVVPAYMASAALVLFVKGTAEPQDLVQQLVFSPSPAFPIVLVVFGVFVAPFTEECLFRGLLYPSIRRGLGGGKRAAIGSAVIVSLLFAAAHGDLLAFLPLFCLAMVLAWVYQRTASLTVVIVAHGVNNLLALLPVLMLRG